MRKTIGTLLLCAWFPLTIAMAFDSEGFYTIAGLMLIVFGTWGGILLTRDNQ